MKFLPLVSLIVVLYFYLYNPIFQILNFGTVKIILILSLVYLLFTGKIFSFIRIFKREILFTATICIYTFISSLWTNIGTTLSYIHLVWFLESFAISFVVIKIYKSVLISNPLISVLIKIGFLAALLTFFLILNPDINSFVRSNIIIDSLDSFDGTYEYRGFSIAESSSYGYGIVQGIILAFCLLQIKNNIIYIIPILFLFISIIFNARIGVAPIFISLLLMVIAQKQNIKPIISIALIVLLGIWLINNITLTNNQEESLNWGLKIFSDTISFINGDDNNSNYSIIFGDMFFLPDTTKELLFGNGIKVFGRYYNSSDVGYVIQIFNGGLIYLGLMLIFLFFLLKRGIKLSANSIQLLLIVLTILIVNIKGNALFIPNGFNRLFILIYVFTILNPRISLDKMQLFKTKHEKNRSSINYLQ